MSDTTACIRDHDALLALMDHIPSLEIVRLRAGANLRDRDAPARLVVQGVKREPVKVLAVRRRGRHHVVRTGDERDLEHVVLLVRLDAPAAEQRGLVAPPVVVERARADDEPLGLERAEPAERVQARQRDGGERVLEVAQVALPDGWVVREREEDLADLGAHVSRAWVKGVRPIGVLHTCGECRRGRAMGR